jgi:hypothetical protein
MLLGFLHGIKKDTRILDQGIVVGSDSSSLLVLLAAFPIFLLRGAMLVLIPPFEAVIFFGGATTVTFLGGELTTLGGDFLATTPPFAGAEPEPVANFLLVVLAMRSNPPGPLLLKSEGFRLWSASF